MIHFGGEKKLSGKVVVAGPRQSGKTTLFEQLRQQFTPGGDVLHMHLMERMISLEGDTLVLSDTLPAIDVHDEVYGYDFVPMKVGEVAGHELAFTLYAFPGHPDAHEAIDRKWRGADVLVFVADSRRGTLDETVASWERVRTNPWFDPNAVSLLVLNHRDAADALPAAELVAALGWTGREVVETIASSGHRVGAVANAIGQALTRAALRALDK
jgi:signal recognition particle receptor subunit beta